MFKTKLEAHLKTSLEVARVTGTERTVHAYALVFFLVFSTVKNCLLNKAQGNVPLPLYICIHIHKMVQMAV